MKKAKINLRKKLREYKFQFDLLQRIPCSREETREYAKILKQGGTLPEGVFVAYADSPEPEFYTVYEADLTEAEISEYLTYKKLSLIKTIKNCMVFFTVLTIIVIIALFLILFL